MEAKTVEQLKIELTNLKSGYSFLWLYIPCIALFTWLGFYDRTTPVGIIVILDGAFLFATLVTFFDTRSKIKEVKKKLKDLTNKAQPSTMLFV